MKQYIYVVLAVAVGIAVFFILANQGDAKALSVNQIGADPAAYSGTITVTGIMGGVSQSDRSIFGIMDLKELQCTSANCNKIFIPVRYQGKMPVLGDEVLVTGSFVAVDSQYLFAAEKVKVVRNHKIGG